MSDNIIKDRIEREADEMIINLYGPYIARLRRQLIAFHAALDSYSYVIAVLIVAALICASIVFLGVI